MQSFVSEKKKKGMYNSLVSPLYKVFYTKSSLSVTFMKNMQSHANSQIAYSSLRILNPDCYASSPHLGRAFKKRFYDR